MLSRILAGIFLGGILGFISGLFIGSAVGASDSSLVYSTNFGVVSGLLICLIIEVNKLNNEKRSNE